MYSIGIPYIISGVLTIIISYRMKLFLLENSVQVKALNVISYDGISVACYMFNLFGLSFCITGLTIFFSGMLSRYKSDMDCIK